jgi:hypothetical protein
LKLLTGNRKQSELVRSMVPEAVKLGCVDRVTVSAQGEAVEGERHSRTGQHQFGASQEKAERKVGACRKAGTVIASSWKLGDGLRKWACR